MYRNRTDRERCSHPPQVLKTWAGTSRANTPGNHGTPHPRRGRLIWPATRFDRGRLAANATWKQFAEPFWLRQEQKQFAYKRRRRQSAGVVGSTRHLVVKAPDDGRRQFLVSDLASLPTFLDGGTSRAIDVTCLIAGVAAINHLSIFLNPRPVRGISNRHACKAASWQVLPIDLALVFGFPLEMRIATMTSRGECR